MRFVFRIVYDAVMRFLQDDGWAIASHIALSILTSLFPFLIFVTALSGFFGTKKLPGGRSGAPSVPDLAAAGRRAHRERDR